MLTAVDLFCGAGGMTAGLARAGFNVIGAVDYWKPAVRTYCRNFSYPAILADLRAISDKEVRGFLGPASKHIDLLVGGPPCQGVSLRNGRSEKNDGAELIFEFVRYVRLLRPRMFLMECRMGISFGRNKNITAQIETALMEAGYGVGRRIVNAAEYDVPQVRNRLFCYGWLMDEMPEFSLPGSEYNSDTFRTVGDAIKDLPPPALARNGFSSDDLHYLIGMSEMNLERLRHLPPGGDVKDLPSRLKPPYYKYKDGSRGHHGAYGRLDMDRPSVAITDGFDSFTKGKFGHPYEDRNITLREGARLQTFPDTFLFEGSQRERVTLIGNATPVLLAERFARALATHLQTAPAYYPVPRRPTTATASNVRTSLKKPVQPGFDFTSEKRTGGLKHFPSSGVSQGSRFHSCFISHSSKDFDLARRIYEDLTDRGVSCWFAPEDLQIGEKFRSRIDEEIRTYDKLLLVLSKNSVSSVWVEKEVETALEREVEQGRIMLFPVRIDDAVMKVKTGWAADIKRIRHIGDFTDWKNKDSYRKGLHRLLRDLEVKPARATSSRPARQSAAL